MRAEPQTRSRAVLRSWRPLRRGSTLLGFAAISLPNGLLIDGISIHRRGERRWAQLPRRPMLDADGLALRDEGGKIRYASQLRWATHGLSARFGQRVIQLVVAEHPDAFDEGEG